MQPRVSTAVSLRITALRFDIFVTPIERTIVTTAASPSGIAATARETATIKNDNVDDKVIASPTMRARTISNTKMNTQIPKTMNDKIFES